LISLQLVKNYLRLLNSICCALDESRIESTWLTGDKSIHKRDDNLKNLRANNKCNVLLASLQAAGVGIDLCCAQNVYMMVSRSYISYWESKSLTQIHETFRNLDGTQQQKRKLLTNLTAWVRKIHFMYINIISKEA
jgi:superfamily II DNA/RNA helicase